MRGLSVDAKCFLTEGTWNAIKSYGQPVAIEDSTAFKDENPLTPDTVCWFCGLHGSEENTLEAAHRIPVKAVVEFALKFKVVNWPNNFVWAHRRYCFKAVELNRQQIMWRLMSFGVKELPSFLPKEILKMWDKEFENFFKEPSEKLSIEEKPFITPTVFESMPSVSVQQDLSKAPRKTLTPPPPSEAKPSAPRSFREFVTVPPPPFVRHKKSENESSKSEDEEEEGEDIIY